MPKHGYVSGRVWNLTNNKSATDLTHPDQYAYNCYSSLYMVLWPNFHVHLHPVDELRFSFKK
jgi:hypothetical protein